MSGFSVTDAFVTLLCGLAGYWLVGFLMKGRGAPPPPSGPAPEPVVEPEAPTWWQVLGVQPEADAAQIRSAYQRLMSQYHPDKVASLGPEIQALALRKSQDIIAAYRAAMKGRAP